MYLRRVLWVALTGLSIVLARLFALTALDDTGRATGDRSSRRRVAIRRLRDVRPPAARRFAERRRAGLLRAWFGTEAGVEPGDGDEVVVEAGGQTFAGSLVGHHRIRLRSPGVDGLELAWAGR